MTTEIQLRQPENLPDLADPFANYDRQNQQPANIFKILHNLLRGRYHWAILLGLIGLGLGAYGGYKAGVQLHGATGMIRVKAVLPQIIAPTPETQMMPMYEQFQQSQAALIRDLRVLEMAIHSDEWKSLGRPFSEELFREFISRLNVTVLPRSEFISVSYVDPDPRAATTAVKAVITAYNRIYVEKAVKDEDQKRAAVDQKRIDLNFSIRNTRDQIIAKAAEYETEENLRSMYNVNMQNLARLKSVLDECRIEMARYGSPSLSATQPSAPTTEPTERKSLTPAEIAMRDTAMRQILADARRLENELNARLKVLGQNHQKIAELRGLLQAKQDEATDYASQYNSAMASAPPTLLQGTVSAGLISKEELAKRQAIYQEMYDKARSDAAGLGKRVVEIDRLRQEEKRLNDEIELVRRRADELATQAVAQGTMQGRIEITNDGSRAMLQKDNRITRAGAGGVGGAGLGVGLVILLSLLDRRFRSPEDVRTSAGRMMLLGVLPSLPDDLADPEQAAIAAHCVHQIRTLLQIGSAGSGSRVLAVTSPAAGTGKTSLTLALGVSYAAANAKTLMIDCDIIGGGLTARVDAIVRRKLGQVLLRQSMITQQQLDMAMKLARTSQKRLGEILVDLGFVTEADVAKALTRQEEMPVGLLDALSGDDLANCVADSGIRGLDILPIGSAQTSDVSKLSPSAIHKLIEKARAEYDQILIDTGPVPGSLEASVVAAAADSVVMVVSRGEHRPLALKSIQHLRDIGARVAGMVFNRAEGRDMDMASTTQRLSSFERGQRVIVPEAEVVETAPRTRLGPVAMAVTGRANTPKTTNPPQEQ